MRYVVLGFLVFATACAGAAPTAPSSSLGQIGTEGAATAAKGGSELPFKGTYEGLETVGTVPSRHHLDATGNTTHLGLFTVTADWTLGPTAGSGTSTWTAANGDEFSTSFTRSRATLTFTEIHTILGGKGRFANASGNFTLVQIRALSTLPSDNSATIDGTINLGR